jgi:1-deoxy-D-xylulose-5-phosphate synthase
MGLDRGTDPQEVVAGQHGATHHGAFDLSFLRCLPNVTIMTPSDEDQCRRMLTTAFRLGTPAAVRYPRGAGPGVAIEPVLETLTVGEAAIVRRSTSRRVAILAFGAPLAAARAAAERLDATVANMRFVKPLDVATTLELARTHEAIVTVEENVVAGGAGSAVAEALAAEGVAIPLLHLGLPDAFIDHGDSVQLLAACGLDADGIVRAIEARFPQRRAKPRVKPAA